MLYSYRNVKARSQPSHVVDNSPNITDDVDTERLAGADRNMVDADGVRRAEHADVGRISYAAIYGYSYNGQSRHAKICGSRIEADQRAVILPVDAASRRLGNIIPDDG